MGCALSSKFATSFGSTSSFTTRRRLVCCEVVASFHSSPGVRLFLASENRTLPNHAMVKAAQFRVDDLTPMDGISDAIWCQAAPSLGVVHYQWYGPGGLDDPVNLTTTLSNASEITESTTFIVVEDDQVGLARPRNMGIGDNEGLYQCVITTNETKHTLVVGVYRTGIYDNNSKVFSILNQTHFNTIFS